MNAFAYMDTSPCIFQPAMAKLLHVNADGEVAEDCTACGKEGYIVCEGCKEIFCAQCLSERLNGGGKQCECLRKREAKTEEQQRTPEEWNVVRASSTTAETPLRRAFAAPPRDPEVSLHQPVPLVPAVAPLLPPPPPHSFILMNLHHDWIHQPLHIDINQARRVRVDGGPWHGEAVYGRKGSLAGTGGFWTLWFHLKADENQIKATKYVQIPGTTSYLHANVGGAAWNSMLIPKVHACTPSRAHRCSPVCGCPIRQC